jgi:uncharacterized protein YcnI
MKQLFALLSITAAALALSSVAQAHVTVHPNALPSGAFTVIDVRVPNERPKAATTKVDVQFPSGILFISYQAMPGWKAKVIYKKLAKPVTVFGSKITQELDRVVWSGGKILPGQFIEFPLSIAVPASPAGTALTFKALQSYSNGEIVRWIGDSAADTPAPQVLVRDKDAQVGDYASVAAARKPASAVPASSATIGAVAAVPLLGLGLVAYRRRRT